MRVTPEVERDLFLGNRQLKIPSSVYADPNSDTYPIISFATWTVLWDLDCFLPKLLISSLVVA